MKGLFDAYLYVEVGFNTHPNRLLATWIISLQLDLKTKWPCSKALCVTKGYAAKLTLKRPVQDFFWKHLHHAMKYHLQLQILSGFFLAGSSLNTHNYMRTSLSCGNQLYASEGTHITKLVVETAVCLFWNSPWPSRPYPYWFPKKKYLHLLFYVRVVPQITFYCIFVDA